MFLDKKSLMLLCEFIWSLSGIERSETNTKSSCKGRDLANFKDKLQNKDVLKVLLTQYENVMLYIQ